MRFVAGSDSMTNHCKDLLSKGIYTFLCPHVNCLARWDFVLVCHVTCLTVEERKEFETKIIENYENKAAGVQKCPGCMIYCERKNTKINRVRCTICSKTKKRPFEFCWSCMGEWRGSGNILCGNSQCDGVDTRITTLFKCGTKCMGFSGQKCLIIRSCPNCEMLIEHKRACKHMDCSSCTHSFCFVCLQGKGSNGKWECSEVQGRCKLAPRQICDENADAAADDNDDENDD